MLCLNFTAENKGNLHEIRLGSHFKHNIRRNTMQCNNRDDLLHPYLHIENSNILDAYT